MNAKHTATPWNYSASGSNMHDNYSQDFAIFRKEDSGVTLVAGVFGDVIGGHEAAKANAAHIVRCVNAHDDLVNALTGLLSESPNQTKAGDAARAALARAKGEA